MLGYTEHGHMDSVFTLRVITCCSERNTTIAYQVPTTSSSPPQTIQSSLKVVVVMISASTSNGLRDPGLRHCVLL